MNERLRAQTVEASLIVRMAMPFANSESIERSRPVTYLYKTTGSLGLVSIDCFQKRVPPAAL